ncbi:MAG TPA: hypothetical protein VHV74_22125 [Pseudonocardiaceae bacterium]|jgi:hypothetical protein|nr:hypothetical protein [Pseudonocardiaceae bacterium]
MHDLGYIVAGYGLTALSVVGYRWRLAVRSRRATDLVRAAAGRKVAVGRPSR